MKRIELPTTDVTFREHDRFREFIGGLAFRLLLEHHLANEPDLLVNPHVKARLSEEAVEWIDAFVARFYKDRVEVNPETVVDLAREIRESKGGGL